MVVVVAAAGVGRRQDIGAAGAVGAGMQLRQRPAGGQLQLDHGQPVVADRLQPGLPGVVLLLAGGDQVEGADQHEVVAFLFALDDRLALRQQGVAVGLDDPAPGGDALGGGADLALHGQLQCGDLGIGGRQVGVGAGAPGLALMEQRQLQGDRGAAAAFVALALALDAEFDLAQPGEPACQPAATLAGGQGGAGGGGEGGSGATGPGAGGGGPGAGGGDAGAGGGEDTSSYSIEGGGLFCAFGNGKSTGSGALLALAAALLVVRRRRAA